MSRVALSIVAIFILILCADVGAQQIYKWKDEKGQWHFSNTPPAKPEVQAVPTGRASNNMIQGSGQVAEVLSVLERQEGKLVEVKFTQNRTQLIVHVSSKLVQFSPGEKLEFFKRTDDNYSYIIRRCPEGGEDFVGTVPKPEATK